MAALFFLRSAMVLSGANEKAPEIRPPQLTHEFRAAWVATVANIDWPSDANLPVAEQKHELLTILQLAKKLNLNALIFQVRPACDAIYESRIEPWSEFLTGEMGRTPEPFYDPLQFAVEESHKLGIELHAWLNPYRARHPSATNEIATNHISKTNPEMVVSYGKYLWLDPGQKAVQDYTAAVVRDIVQRYDVDGIHLDDYFYPYRESDEKGQPIDFPDEQSWTEFLGNGGVLSREDWRRENVNKLVERLYHEIKNVKPWVKFGISPFGIWKPGFPQEVKGFNAFEQIYCDSLKWLTNGWVDYFAPQLYWKIEATEQSYPTLLKWWTEQNEKGRHIWPGNFTSRVDEQWPVSEIVNQIKATRSQAGATGNIHFSMKPLMQNRARLSDQLLTGVYAEPALIPASPWLKKASPAMPILTVQRTKKLVRAQWHATEQVSQWAIQRRINGRWQTEVVPANTLSSTYRADVSGHLPDVIAVSAVNRYGLTSPAAVSTIE